MFSILAIDADVRRICRIRLINPAITEFYDCTAMTTLLLPVSYLDLVVDTRKSRW